MTETELQDFLYQNIPSSRALGIRITECTPQSLTLTMPHQPNRNHKNTVFGGSMALGATLCGWAMVHVNCPEAEGSIVIRQGETQYLKPALGDLTVKTLPVPPEEWQTMREHLHAAGKGKIVLKTEMYSDGLRVAVFRGKYVALLPQ